MTPLDPVDEFRAFKPNTRRYAEYWLRSGSRHKAEHFVITAKLDPWCKRVEGAGEEGVAKLRELAAAEPRPEPPKSPRKWVMPNSGHPMDQGGLLTTLQPTSVPQITTLSRPQLRAHRSSYRGEAICERCEAAFSQPRGPSSKFCLDCRKVARQEAARLHMRVVREVPSRVAAA